MPKKRHVLEYSITDKVYLKSDIQQLERIVTGITLRPYGAVLYLVSLGTEETPHYSFELTPDRDVIKATT